MNKIYKNPSEAWYEKYDPLKKKSIQEYEAFKDGWIEGLKAGESKTSNILNLRTKEDGTK